MRISDWSSDVCSSDLPIPGATPSLISGWPNFAVSAARMKSAIIASSQPPPSAKPATAAIHGLRVAVTLDVHPEKKSSRKKSAASFSDISLRSEEHTSELQSLMRISYAVFCLKQKNINTTHHSTTLNN